MLCVTSYVIIVDGKKIADRIKDEIVAEVLRCNNNDICATKRPLLAIILVGERPDSALYVSLKEKEAKKVGIDTSLYRLPEDAPATELEEMIKFLNKDESTDAILLQLPLPAQMNADKMVALIKPEKDVDGFHPENLKKLNRGLADNVPPVAQVVLEILDEIKVDAAGKKAVIVANSKIFGQALAKVLELHGAAASVVSSSDKKLAEKTSQADILITAAGEPGLITAEHVKKGAVVIDVGITKMPDGRVRGDVDAESVKDQAGYLTPVPGGVGPITIAAALRNTLEIWENKNK
ncbi:MAG TPA: bifunctional 5,10-methylenetetrahydrofolate dehydrogenase/5,10-methenyltetrahydrofolate cyclohydrolase [Candidatus Methylomirabilis sp.]|nr:bifunctional 5,10-methylenetetrahydrofolate dehydrogenase/5,10-methenyltetrahydrofolate cyclohydrolase [Candidatus Methylomirabilis sp.]